MNTSIKRLILTLTLFASLRVEIYSQLYEGKCNLSRAAGFENEGATGQAVCGEYTSDISQAKIFITTKDGYIYAHSNFISPDYGFKYSTKVASSKRISLKEIGKNIFFAEQPSSYEYAKMLRVLKNDVEIIVDPKLINDLDYGTKYFNDLARVSFLCPDGTARSAIKIKNRVGGFEFGIKYNDQFSTRIKDQNLSFIFSELRTQKIDFDRIKIINLVDNSSTKNVLKNKFSEKLIPFDFSSKENFKNLLLSNKGKRTAIIGHIENGDFVTIDKAGKETFRIPISEIEIFQKENKLELIILGCNSAGEGAGSGPLNKFNSIDALNRLKTTEKTENLEQFLDSLSFGTLHFVIDETFFRLEQDVVSTVGNRMPDKIEISVYEKPKGEINSVKNLKYKGSIIILGLGTAEFNPSPIISPPSTDTSQVVNPQSDSAHVTPPNNVDKIDNIRNIILFLVIGGGVIGLIVYIIKSSNKS